MNASTSSNVQLYTVDFKATRAWILAALFITGNVALPMICHLIPGGGPMLLPIYFFTLVGAYKYGWKVGLLTALLSPIVNSLLTGMPAAEVLPAITVKSVILASVAGYTAYRFRSISLPILAAVVLTSQIAGCMAEWGIYGSFFTAVQDFRIGIAGMAIQVIGGYFLLRYIMNK
ncbi:MAG: ECF transporter S component [Muribaculaceae bacterium]|nr:ECF transporter S component [Muribaculaceae bacterium]